MLMHIISEWETERVLPGSNMLKINIIMHSGTFFADEKIKAFQSLPIR